MCLLSMNPFFANIVLTLPPPRFLAKPVVKLVNLSQSSQSLLRVQLLNRVTIKTRNTITCGSINKVTVAHCSTKASKNAMQFLKNDEVLDLHELPFFYLGTF